MYRVYFYVYTTAGKKLQSFFVASPRPQDCSSRLLLSVRDRIRSTCTTALALNLGARAMTVTGQTIKDLLGEKKEKKKEASNRDRYCFQQTLHCTQPNASHRALVLRFLLPPPSSSPPPQPCPLSPLKASPGPASTERRGSRCEAKTSPRVLMKWYDITSKAGTNYGVFSSTPQKRAPSWRISIPSFVGQSSYSAFLGLRPKNDPPPFLRTLRPSIYASCNFGSAGDARRGAVRQIAG